MAIRPSPHFAILLLLFHVTVAATLYLTVLSAAARLVLLAPMVPSLFYYLARDALLLLPTSWCEVSFERGGMSVVARDGSRFSGRVTGDTVVSPWFAVLRIRPEGRRFPVSRAIFPDMLGADEFRELCMRLRLDQ